MNTFNLEKQHYVQHFCSNRGFKGTVVNRTLHFLLWEWHEITLTVILKRVFIFFKTLLHIDISFILKFLKQQQPSSESFFFIGWKQNRKNVFNSLSSRMKVLRVIDMLTLNSIFELSRDDFKGTVSCKRNFKWPSMQKWQYLVNNDS